LTVALRSPVTPAAPTASSALSELTTFEPAEAISWRSVMAAGGANVRAPVVPKKPRARVAPGGVATDGAVIELR
jgi:hypothetical protein